MAPRVIIGQRAGAYGMWVSKPGKSALSSSDDDMLLSPSRALTQPYMIGHIYAPSNGAGTGTAKGYFSNTRVSLTINHNLGYIPVVVVFGQIGEPYIYATPFAEITTTTIAINGSADNTDPSGSGSSQYYFVDCVYVIFRTMLAAS